mmetsp:Transcript_7375/g.29071  ORF Transcript_7375/g.29071 Transcript_7375/m.29071 type:complete len:342 (+) Transcript_7375:1075-2100(+)
MPILDVGARWNANRWNAYSSTPQNQYPATHAKQRPNARIHRQTPPNPSPKPKPKPKPNPKPKPKPKPRPKRREGGDAVRRRLRRVRTRVRSMRLSRRRRPRGFAHGLGRGPRLARAGAGGYFRGRRLERGRRGEGARRVRTSVRKVGEGGGVWRRRRRRARRLRGGATDAIGGASRRGDGASVDGRNVSGKSRSFGDGRRAILRQSLRRRRRRAGAGVRPRSPAPARVREGAEAGLATSGRPRGGCGVPRGTREDDARFVPTPFGESVVVERRRFESALRAGVGDVQSRAGRPAALPRRQGGPRLGVGPTGDGVQRRVRRVSRGRPRRRGAIARERRRVRR